MDNVYCCGSAMTGNFCPECGKPRGEADQEVPLGFPCQYMTWYHGNGRESESRQKVANRFFEDDAEMILNCDYEVGVLWEVPAPGVKPIPIGLDVGPTYFELREIPDKEFEAKKIRLLS